MRELAFPRPDVASHSAQPTLQAEDLAWRRRVLLAAIVITAILPLKFVQFDDAGTPLLKVVKLLAKTGSLAGTVLLVWQVAIGVRHIAARILPDLPWLISLHKHLGRWGFALIALHPIFITLYYAMTHGSLPLVTAVVPRVWVALGVLAFALMLLIVGTSVRSARDAIGYRPWFKVHQLAYAVLPLALLHALPIGSSIAASPTLYYAYRVLAGVLVALYAIRLVARFRARRYVVMAAESVGDETIEITLRPLGRKLMPRTGQFVYVRGSAWGRGHPYSVTRFDAETGAIAMTAKAFGPFSRALQEIEPGQMLKLDGPYGVFTQDVLAVEWPVVVLAGGIGITPFVRMIRTRAPRHGRGDWLFYANPNADDIVYRRELEAHSSFRIVHVLEDASGARESSAAIEEGLVTVDLLRKHLGSDLGRYVYFVCGPPAMAAAVRSGLAEAGVPDERVRFEVFDA